MLEKNASDLNIPIFMSETGCNTVKPRTFDDQTALLGPEMGTWSGAIIYEWIQELNDYGLISYGQPANPTATGANVVEGFTRAGTPTPISPDFENLSNHWKTLNPTGISMDAYTPLNKPPPCPSFTEGFWVVSADAPLPTIGASLPPDATVYTSPPTAGPTKIRSTDTAAADGAGGSRGSDESTGSTDSSTGSAARQTPFFAKALRRWG